MPANNIRKASRRGRYRKSLLAPESLSPIAHKLEAFFNTLDQKRNEGLLSDAAFIGYGLLTLLACRRADAFQNNTTRNTTGRKTCAEQAEVLPTTTTGFTLADFWQLLCMHELPVGNYRKIFDQNISLHTFLHKIRFRGIPDSAQMALLKWLDNHYPLSLVFHVPSATDVFELQKKGGRCISFFKQAAELTVLHHDRDAMSFIIHDLIHAHEFYANPQRAKQQIGFYHWLDNIKTHPGLVTLQAESAGFLTRWEYVLSDMNSYCGHLLKTLNAAFTISAPGDGANLWNSIVNTSDLAPDEKILFRKINSVDWTEADFLQLEAALEKIFQNSGADFV